MRVSLVEKLRFTVLHKDNELTITAAEAQQILEAVAAATVVAGLLVKKEPQLYAVLMEGLSAMAMAGLKDKEVGTG